MSQRKIKSLQHRIKYHICHGDFGYQAIGLALTRNFKFTTELLFLSRKMGKVRINPKN